MHGRFDLVPMSEKEQAKDNKSAPRSPNDQRSDVFNPTSPDSKAAADNKSNQMNPNNPAYQKSKGKGK